MAEFIRESGIRAEWHSLSPADRDVTRLSEQLENCLRRLAPVPEVKPIRRAKVRPTWTPNVVALSQTLLQLAARLGPEPVLLVLDDFHNVDSSADVALLVTTLIENSPSCLRFVILSRCVPRLPLAKFKVRQEFSIVCEDELRFTRDETSRFFKSEHALDLDDKLIDLAQERTEGWVAGLVMVLQSTKSGNQDRAIALLSDPIASTWLVYDYLAEEVFDSQETRVQDFLAKTSILNQMTAASCDSLLDSTSSQHTLLELEERGLFTSSVDPGKQIFRYHQLFLAFLRQKLYQRESRDRVETLHFKAATFYEREEEWEECVYHYLKAAAHSDAARVIESIGNRYIFTGYSQTVEHWLRALPENVTSTRPWSLAMRGRLYQMSARHEEALTLLERSLRLFSADSDQDGQAWTMGEIAYVKYRIGRLGEALRHFDAAISTAREDSALRSELFAIQAMAQREAGMLEESAESCRLSMQALAAVDDEFKRLWGKSRAWRSLALAQMEMGQVMVARRTARDAVSFCVTNQIGEHEEAWSLAFLGATLWACGEFDESIHSLDHALSLTGRHAANLRGFIAIWRGNSYRDRGELSKAEQSYSQGGDTAELEGFFAKILMQRQQADQARVIDLFRECQHSESIIAKSTARVILAAALREHREPGRALPHIRDAVQLLKAHGYQLRLASALLHQARIEFDLSKPSDARKSLAQAFGLAESYGYYHFHWWDPELVATLCCKAISDDVNPSYAKDLAMRRFDGNSLHLFAPLMHDRRLEVRRMAREVVEALHQRGGQTAQTEILADCSDPAIRESLLQAVCDGVISFNGIQVLRANHGLSWREIEILIEYYLRSAGRLTLESGRLRTECARKLNISENTVRCHVNNIRGKLSLPPLVSGSRVLDWAQQEGLLPASRPD
ncbi:MAG: tetratricopeptide repeat protein [Chloroflexota bacterium]